MGLSSQGSGSGTGSVTPGSQALHNFISQTGGDPLASIGMAAALGMQGQHVDGSGQQMQPGMMPPQSVGMVPGVPGSMGMSPGGQQFDPNAMRGAADQFRTGIQDWRSQRPDHQSFTGDPQAWRQGMDTWRQGRPQFGADALNGNVQQAGQGYGVQMPSSPYGRMLMQAGRANGWR